MDFCVLGPLRVNDGETVFSLGGPKPRTLLALLVASVGVPVSTDSLLMGMYGPDAAPKSRRSLATYVSTLRKTLGDVVQRSGDGYVLAADPQSIDAVRFEASIKRARNMTDETSSSDLLRRGLELWRGTAYADVEGAEILATEIRRLDELRAEAFEARIELDLRAGRHRELLAELEALIVEHPLRERLRGQQMLALYRSGRQADALRAYRLAADHLREELGLDPSRELQDLEQLILQQDRELDYRPRPRPRPVPARYSSFVGRETELRDVGDALAESRLITLTGPGGIGKSSLAVEVARSAADTRTVAYAPIERRRDSDVLSVLAEAVGVIEGGDGDLLQRITETLGDRRNLVVLDGCEHVIDELPPIVSGILRSCPETVVLMTSREGLFVAGERLIRLGPLEMGEASAANRLFADRAGVPLDDAGATAQVTKIAERVSGMPLALELAAARSRTASLDEILRELDDQMTLLSAKRRADSRHLSMAATLDWSFEGLDPDLRRSFRRLAVFHSGVPLDGARAVLGIDPVEPNLRQLVDLSMLGPLSDEGTYPLLEPVRQYAQQRLEEAGELEAARLSHAAWTADRWRRRYLAFEAERDSAFYAMLRDDGPEAAAVATWAVGHDHPDIALAIVAAIGRAWSRFFDPLLLGEPALCALDHAAATRSDTYVRALACAAWLYRIVDQPLARRLLRRLEEESRGLTELETTRAVLEIRAILPQVLDNLWLEQVPMTRALARYDEFLECTARLGWRIEPLLYNRSVFLDVVGRHDAAELEIRKLLEWAETTGRHDERAHALKALAGHDFMRGDLELAIDRGREAARMATELQDLQFALEAERQNIWMLTLADRVPEAAVTMLRYNEYAELIGIPTSEELNPQLGARIAAVQKQWDTFEALAGVSADRAKPALTDGGKWAAFLTGLSTFPADIVYLMYPTVKWLVHEGRIEEARRVLAAAPMAMAETAFPGWVEIGEADRLRRLSEELEVEEVEGVPNSLGALFLMTARFFRPDFG